MSLTVRRLTQHSDLGLSLVAGREGADRVIDWAHPIELADPTPWISGGELVMTTGLKIGPTAEEQFDYVARLVQAGTVALAFDTGTTFERVPAGVLSAGDAFGLPILAVPASTPFIAITRVVIDELTADQLRGIQRVVDHQEKLARATLRGGIPAVISMLGRVLSSTVAVIDSDSHVLAVHGADSVRVIRHTREVAGTALSAPGRRRPTSKVIADDHGYCTVQTVSAAQDLHGYLAVSSDDLLSASDRLLVAHAVSLVSIELGKPAKVVDTEQRLRAAVTRALLDLGGDLDVSLLRYFGFDTDSQVVALVLTNVGPLLAAERQIAAALTGQSTPYLMVPTENDLIVIVPEERSLEVGPHLQHQVGAQLERALRGGRGLPTPIFTAASSVRQATAAARAGRLQMDRITDFAELGTFSLLLGSQSPAELRALEQSMLATVDTYDAAHPASSSLVSTLTAFLEHNGHTETAAAALGVHRHTLRNRLVKISDLTGRELDSAHVRAELWIAVQARELLRTMGEEGR
ncbi:PucR family transcriptional regulator [Rhodococcus pseudokoreensis]|uniref:PucR family transcriptional regulator n=1 Tax=Rhodococcus pseudokoreensis TaxID=2811421 RepID=A0A974VYV0_9NOCA|nr:PucR family transcriptional regulator [Rhodococcus pseudokoreensis]QSE88123.1 PucR family transcriptional regulator [Rhodococcus pseudokoreensis]